MDVDYDNDNDDDDAYHLHGTHRTENSCLRMYDGETTPSTEKPDLQSNTFFSSVFFFAFVTFEYAMRSVFVARVFSLATSEFVELFLKQTKKRAKFMVITVVSSVFFWGFVLFGVNMKIPRTFKRRAIYCSCFDFWTRKE